MQDQQIVELVADIVSAHVANNTVSVGDVPSLIEKVYTALSTLTAPPTPEQQEKTPVVSVRASIKPEYLVCMECGRKQKTLKRHLQSAHGMSPDQYRSDYGLPRDYPMVAPRYSEHRRSLAHASGLGRKKGARAPARPASAAPDAQPKPRGRKPRATPQE